MPRAAFYLVFVASGFAGLVYESIWTQYLRLFLGHAAYAQSLVLVVFMGGMALGAAGCARWSAAMARPLLAYALVEALVGGAALIFHEAFVLATDWAYDALLPALGAGAPVLVAKLALSCALIGPQSVLLGATFPLLSAALVRAQPARAGESIAMLYFSNSLGGVLGVLASGFFLIAAAGLPGTLRIAGALNLVLAVLVAALERRPGPAALAEHPRGAPPAWLLWAAFLTGLASFFYEIGWIRMLALVLGASTHSFELMLASFILGLALGGLAIRRHVDRSSAPERLLGWVQVAMALAALATLPAYNQMFDLMAALMRGLARTDAGYVLFSLGGAGISLLVMLPATFCAGMTLPLITGALLRSGAGEGAVGRVYAANTLGAIAGVVLAVHAGFPLLGLKGLLLAGCAVDAAVGIALLARFSRPRPAGAAAAGCAALLAAAGFGVHFDANRMTAGVFRYGDLAESLDAKVLYARDGKTATVHLVRYGDTLSLRTNGKSDGSVNVDPADPPGSDEVTMVLTGALPLALRPGARSAAVIGIGTGLTTHTLLQDLELERVDTVEIEAAMADAARGFLPRNSAAFADPRSSILIDDAKTFFTARRSRYDLIVSEPSNPWVSGVSSLFTREFYRRIRGHLASGGLLAQWFQLYEIDTARVASVMRALGEAFPHYAVYALSDHDLLIVAAAQPLAAAPQASVFEHPALSRELVTVGVLSPGDLDARYIGGRATLEPLFASYGAAVNSDYDPVLDLGAARDRFTEKSAAGIVDLLNAPVPVLELLEPAFRRRPVDPLFAGADNFERVKNTQRAWYARNFLVGARAEAAAGLPAQLQKDLELVRLRLVECRQPREFDVWIYSAVRVAQAVNPFLEPDAAAAVWTRIVASPCHAGLGGAQKRWIELFRAVALRDARRMADLAAALLEEEPTLGGEAREYALLSGLAGFVGSGRRAQALAFWRRFGEGYGRSALPEFRLLLCHAGPCGG